MKAKKYRIIFISIIFLFIWFFMSLLASWAKVKVIIAEIDTLLTMSYLPAFFAKFKLNTGDL